MGGDRGGDYCPVSWKMDRALVLCCPDQDLSNMLQVEGQMVCVAAKYRRELLASPKYYMRGTPLPAELPHKLGLDEALAVAHRVGHAHAEDAPAAVRELRARRTRVYPYLYTVYPGLKTCLQDSGPKPRLAPLWHLSNAGATARCAHVHAMWRLHGLAYILMHARSFPCLAAWSATRCRAACPWAGGTAQATG